MDVSYSEFDANSTFETSDLKQQKTGKAVEGSFIHKQGKTWKDFVNCCL